MAGQQHVSGVTGIILAAGLGRRFDPSGQQLKLLAKMDDGRTMVRRICETALSVLDEVLIVCDVHEQILRQELGDLPIRFVQAPAAIRGMGVSLKAGIQACSPQYGYVVLLADMPWLQPSSVAAVAQAVQDGAGIVRPIFNGQTGNPVGFGLAWRQLLLALSDEQGARALLQANQDQTLWVPLVDEGILRDVDTPGDLEMPRTSN
ncbi:nucleotidyltransferase family protein [Alcaligenes aquatilis]|uniref:Nucleotidyltransferase family protein n=1 Tax=Alcaligenes aquatilis TaxID=323284 RepID=A0A3G2HXT7_9BURK|nr:nucleotidyltransferase family protein [Alcaligenes aquatilis]AYN21877.1 nucleotidyltransferase family protein [Alcaligenes aquatilis]